MRRLGCLPLVSAIVALGAPGPRAVSISDVTCRLLAASGSLDVGCRLAAACAPAPECAAPDACCCAAETDDHSREVTCDACVCVGCGIAVQTPEIVVAPPSQLLRDFPDWNRTFASVPADIAIPPPKLLG